MSTINLYIFKQIQICLIIILDIKRNISKIITKSLKNNIPVGIATNNSEECIRKFFCLRDIDDKNIHISGREALHPEHLKPDPWTLITVMSKMGSAPENSVFIGDSLNDYACSKKLSVKFIGMASTPKKMKRLKDIPDNIDIIEDYNINCKPDLNML